MRFWDSSAIVPLLVHEAATPQVRDLLRLDPVMLAWWGTPIECASAICRLEREGAITSAIANESRARLREMRRQWIEVEPDERVRDAAERFLRVHPLHAADAAQLAAAFVAAEADPPSLELVCYDQRLSEAAAREGFRVTPASIA
jgi:uncharacterized protein